MKYSEEDINRIINSPEESAAFIDAVDLELIVKNAGIKTNKELKELFIKEKCSEHKIKYALIKNVTSKSLFTDFNDNYVDNFIRGAYADLDYKYRKEFLRLFFKLFNGKLVFMPRSVFQDTDYYLVYDRDKDFNKKSTKRELPTTELHYNMFRYGYFFINTAIWNKRFIHFMDKKYKKPLAAFNKGTFAEMNYKDRLAFLAEKVLLGAKSSANHVRYTLKADIRSVQFIWWVFCRFVDLLKDCYGEKYLQTGVIQNAINRGVLNRETDILNSRILACAQFKLYAQE